MIRRVSRWDQAAVRPKHVSAMAMEDRHLSAPLLTDSLSDRVSSSVKFVVEIVEKSLRWRSKNKIVTMKVMLCKHHRTWHSLGLKNGFISGWSCRNAAICAAAIDSIDVMLGSAASVFKNASKFFVLSWEDSGCFWLWFLAGGGFCGVSELELESSDSMIWKWNFTKMATFSVWGELTCLLNSVSGPASASNSPHSFTFSSLPSTQK